MKLKSLIKLFVVLSIIFVSSESFAQMIKDDAIAVFGAANDQYQIGAYDNSIELYEEVIKSGWQSPALYYNLGNTYHKKEELGRAILNYERALLIAPRDADINANYKFVLSEARVSRKVKEINLIQRLMQKHINFYTFDEITLIVFGLIFVVAVLVLMRDKFVYRQGLFISLIVGLSVLFIIHVLAFVIKYNDLNKSAIILVEKGARYEPRNEAVVHYHMHQGEKVKIIKKLGEWVKVERKDKKLGWVERQAVEKIL